MPTALASNAAAVTAGYKEVQLDRGAAKSPRFITRHEFIYTGEPSFAETGVSAGVSSGGSSGGLAVFEGTSDASQAAADAVALASLNAWRDQRYGLAAAAGVTAVGTVTVTAANPAVFTEAAHGLTEKDTVRFTTTTTLPAGLALATDYFVRNPTANTFNVSITRDGPLVATTDTGTGTHTTNKTNQNKGPRSQRTLTIDVH